MDLPKPHPEYCPSCGKQLGNTVEEGRQRLYCSSCQKVVWMNPDMVAGVAVIKDNELLLIKRGIEPNKGSLSFPAGYLEIDEKPIEAASRELEEETGIKTNLEDLEFFNHIKIYNELGGHVILYL